MSNEKSVRQVLVDARELLVEKFGTGDLYNRDKGCFCSLGAIAVASGVEADVLVDMPGDAWEDINPPAVETLAATIRTINQNWEEEEDPVEVVWTYNDSQKKDKVLEAFDAAIAKMPE